ncbi:hypothetical protein BI335_03980 [Enemella evansiae]|uniref:hypothetical protein n=1 Tax=Enemella evansiae TaxID=2016499 RepID=UPI000B9692F4|nr:hypothetical protein [Enemella evansiae]OYO19683.1 hypothetical protein BI335_03980 [Enemella evansiae]
MSSNPPPRLFLDDGPEIVLSEGHRLQAALSVLPAGLRDLPGTQLADRLDLLGQTAARARAALAAELEITNRALDRLPEPVERRRTWSLDPHGSSTGRIRFDVDRWLELYASARSAAYRRQLIDLVSECPLLLLLRACLLARPQTRIRLIGAGDRSAPPPHGPVVVVESARRAMRLRARLAAEHPGLSDLIRVVSIPMGPDGDDPEGLLTLLGELGVESADLQMLGVEDGPEPVDEPCQ